MKKRVRVLVNLKKGVLDTQGKAIENSLVKNLGFSQISEVRQGRVIEFDIDCKSDSEIKPIVADLCDKLLVNGVIEEYSFEIL